MAVFWFATKLAGITALYYCFAGTKWYGTVLAPYLEANARMGHFILACVGETTHVAGPTFWSERYSVTILPACSASEIMWFFCAAIICFPAFWRQRIAGMVMGVLALGVLNVVRVVSVYWMGVHFPAYADIVHEELWTPLLVAATIILYAAWVIWKRRGDPKWQTGTILGASKRMIIVYALFFLPWPILADAYGAFFRSLAETVFAGVNDRRELTFETPSDRPSYFLPTRAVIANRALMAHDGSGPVRNLDFNTWDLGWRPTELLLAMVVATPISWARRWRAFVVGFIVLHIASLVTLWASIQMESTEIGLVTFTPFWKSVAVGLRDALISQLSIAGPVVVWIVVTFRDEDGFRGWRRPKLFHGFTRTLGINQTCTQAGFSRLNIRAAQSSSRQK